MSINILHLIWVIPVSAIIGWAVAILCTAAKNQ